jgi:hypothetical protein
MSSSSLLLGHVVSADKWGGYFLGTTVFGFILGIFLFGADKVSFLPGDLRRAAGAAAALPVCIGQP